MIMMMIQVRLLLEKGASVEGNIDLDLDILTETPLQVIVFFMIMIIVVIIVIVAIIATIIIVILTETPLQVIHRDYYFHHDLHSHDSGHHCHHFGLVESQNHRKGQS